MTASHRVILSTAYTTKDIFLYPGNNLNVLTSDSNILSSVPILVFLPLVRTNLQCTLNTALSLG